MSTKLDRDLIERIFSDAHIIDVDFSAWDKQIIILAVSDHYKAWSDRLPVVSIKFKTVTKLSYIALSPSKIKLDDPKKHLQWTVDDFDIRESDATIQLRLSGSASSPVLSVECEAVEVEPVSNRKLDEVFPGWNRPFAGMVRRSVEDMINTGADRGSRGR